jgi:hypothetical protein
MIGHKDPWVGCLKARTKGRHLLVLNLSGAGLLLFLLPVFSLAQEFRPILLDTARWYVDESTPVPHSTLGIRIDSMGVSGSDSVLFNYKVFNNSEEEEVESPFMNSWIGPYVTVQPNRSVFFNDLGDSLFIPRYFPVDPEWRLYTYPNGDHIGFSSVSVVAQQVIGIPDTVLKLVLAVYDEVGQELNLPGVTGMELLIGKKNGLVRFFDVRVFPQVVRVVSLSPIYNRTYWAKYTNYSPGDILTSGSVFTPSSQPPDYHTTRTRLLAVSSTSANARVFSTAVTQIHTFLNFGTFQWVTDSTTTNGTISLPIYPDSVLVIPDTLMPYEATPYGWKLDAWVVNDRMYFERDTTLECAPFKHSWASFPLAGLPWLLQDSVWRKMDWISDGVFCSGTDYHDSYHRTGTSCMSNQYMNSYSSSSYSYAQISGATCGKTIVGIEEQLLSGRRVQSLIIYPNPASNRVRLEFHNIDPPTISNLIGITVTDVVGHSIVVPAEGVGERMELDIAHLSAGLYTVSATIKGGPVLHERLVVE